MNLFPISSQANPFLGTLNGNYYSIYNLQINLDSENYVGLFRCLGNNSTVKKLNIRPIIVSSTEIYGNINGKDYVGSIAGYSDGFIWDCSNVIDITGDCYVGGISGHAKNISRSFNIGAISGNSNIGGLVGKNTGSLQNSFNSGYIKCEVGYGGGITGINSGLIDKCYNSGDVESSEVSGNYTGSIKGGIVGQNIDNGNIRYCYNIANIKGSGSAVLGGLIGENQKDLSNSYFNIEIAIGLSAVGNNTGNIATTVSALTTVQMIGENAFNYMISFTGKYVSNENRAKDADFAPQLINFQSISISETENKILKMK